MALKISRIKLYGDIEYDNFEENIVVPFKCNIQLNKKSICQGRLLFGDKEINIRVDFFAYADAKGSSIRTPKYIQKQKEEIVQAFLASPSYEKIREKLELLIASKQDSRPLPIYELVDYKVVPENNLVNIRFTTQEVPQDFENVISFVYDKKKQVWVLSRLVYPYKLYFGFTEQLSESMKEEFKLALLLAQGEIS